MCILAVGLPHAPHTALGLRLSQSLHIVALSPQSSHTPLDFLTAARCSGISSGDCGTITVTSLAVIRLTVYKVRLKRTHGPLNGRCKIVLIRATKILSRGSWGTGIVTKLLEPPQVGGTSESHGPARARNGPAVKYWCSSRKIRSPRGLFRNQQAQAAQGTASPGPRLGCCGGGFRTPPRSVPLRPLQYSEPLRTSA